MARKPAFDWATVQEAADALECSCQNVIMHIKRGRLSTARQVSGVWLIHKSDLGRFKKLRESGAFKRNLAPDDEEKCASN